MRTRKKQRTEVAEAPPASGNSSEEEETDVLAERRVLALQTPKLQYVGKTQLATLLWQYNDFCREWENSNVNGDPPDLLQCFSAVQLKALLISHRDAFPESVSKASDITAAQVQAICQEAGETITDVDKANLGRFFSKLRLSLKIPSSDRVAELVYRYTEISVKHGLEKHLQDNQKLAITILVKAVEPAEVRNQMQKLLKNDKESSKDLQKFLVSLDAAVKAQDAYSSPGNSRGGDSRNDRGGNSKKGNRDGRGGNGRKPHRGDDGGGNKPKDGKTRDPPTCFHCGETHLIWKCDKITEEEKKKIYEEKIRKFKKTRK